MQTIRKNNYLNNIEIYEYPKKTNNFFQEIQRNFNISRPNIMIIDGLDLIMDDFAEKSESFIQTFNANFPNTLLIFTFQFGILYGWEKSCTNLYRIEENNSNYMSVSLIDRHPEIRFNIDKMGSKIYGFYSTKFNEKKCTCGAIKTYGKIALNHSKYHYCDLLPLNQ